MVKVVSSGSLRLLSSHLIILLVLTLSMAPGCGKVKVRGESSHHSDGDSSDGDPFFWDDDDDDPFWDGGFGFDDDSGGDSWNDSWDDGGGFDDGFDFEDDFDDFDDFDF